MFDDINVLQCTATQKFQKHSATHLFFSYESYVPSMLTWESTYFQKYTQHRKKINLGNVACLHQLQSGIYVQGIWLTLKVITTNAHSIRTEILFFFSVQYNVYILTFINNIKYKFQRFFL